MPLVPRTLTIYGCTIAVLLVLVTDASLRLSEPPAAAIVAVAASVGIQLWVSEFWFRRRIAVPYPAIITGLIIAAVIPPDTPIGLVLVATSAAMAVKFLVRWEGVAVFNTAVVGLLVLLVVFRTPYTVAGGGSPIAIGLLVAPLLALAIYSVNRLPAALAFGASYAFLAVATLGLVPDFSAVWMWTLITSGYYAIAIIMIGDPRTGPVNRPMQVVYGAGIGIVAFIVGALGLSAPFLFALLVGNLAYTVYRSRHQLSSALPQGSHERDSLDERTRGNELGEQMGGV